jgi:hypothetical protein
MSFIDDVKTIEFKTYADETQGDGLVRIQWRNGEARSKTGGYFFVAAERLGDFKPSAPWVPFTDTFDDGSESEGFKAEALQIAVIGVRQQPFLRKDGTKVWLEKYAKGEQGASLQVDVLCIAEGLEDLGVVVWGSATVKTSFAVVGRPDGIIHRIQNDILKPAGALAKKDMRPWCFWAPVATEKDDKGKVVYTQTQGKPVTRPVLALPKEVTKEWLVAQYTGKDMVEFGEQLRASYDEWLRERRTNEAAPVQSTNGKNVPQPIELQEVDIPF